MVGLQRSTRSLPLPSHVTISGPLDPSLWGAMYYSVCSVIIVLVMTFYHVTRSSISYVVLCLLAVQMSSTLCVACCLNVLGCDMVY